MASSMTMIFLLLFLAYTTCVSCSPSPNQLHAQVHPRETTNSSPFKLKVHSANANANANANPEHELNDRLLHVCNLQFWTGEDAKTCTYCFEAPPQFVCSRYGNQTVLLASGAMSVDVPGSQYWFVDPPTGRLRTTGAGKAAGGYGREFAGKGVTVSENGDFERDGWDYWLACQTQEAEKKLFAVFAPLNDTVPETCEKIKLGVLASTEPKEGAYSYA